MSQQSENLWQKIIHQGEAKIEPFDWLLIVIYSVLSFFLYQNRSDGAESFSPLVFVLNLLFPLYLYFLYFKKLRIFKLYFIWFIIGILQLELTYQLSPPLDEPIGLTFWELQATLLVMLITLKIFDILYLKIYNEHLIIVHQLNHKERIDSRNYRFVDYVLTLVGAVIIVILPIVFF